LDAVGSVDYLRTRERETLLTGADLIRWTLKNAGRYDTIHYHTHVDRSFASYWLASVLGKRIILSATLDDSTSGIAQSYRPAFRPIVRQLLRRFDAFVSISPKLHEETVADIGGGRAHLIPMGIYMPALQDDRGSRARASLDIPVDAQVLVSVGGISERKDQMTLVQAMPALLKDSPNLLLILVGPVLEEPYAQALHAFIDRHGLQRHVRFAGWVREPWPYYCAADIMVFASRDEGFGTVMIEAMSFGLPVVARRLKGVNDSFIEHGNTGFLFDRDEEFAALASRLLADGNERAKIGQSARAYVEPRFTMDSVAVRYLELYGVPAQTD
jgi:glycosyltransferase involved in cell wall biosynthesis